MKPKISIIVPIYNVEDYLERCLNSLLMQKMNDIEIIAVNDGSIDSSLFLLKKYAERDNRIKIIDKKNGGVSSARNAGLLVARGEFIGFVDPDDWIDPEMYEVLYTTAVEEKCDVVMCSYVREFENHSKEKDFNIPDKLIYRGNEVKNKMMRRIIGPLGEETSNPEFLDAWGTVWSKIYRTELLKEHNLVFTDLQKIGTNEDSLFNIQVLYYADSFCFTNNCYYHYWRANNKSHTSGYNPILIEQWFTLYNIIETFLKEKDLSKEFYLALNNRICLNILGLGLNTISKRNKSSIKAKIKKLNTIISDNRIRNSFKQLDLAPFPIVWKVFYFFAKARIAVGLFFMLVGVEGMRKIIR